MILNPHEYSKFVCGNPSSHPDEMNEDYFREKYKDNFKDCFEFACPDGWKSLVYDLIEKCIAIQPGLRIHQIKSKFGELCFYAEVGFPEVYGLIDICVVKSRTTCEYCGKPAFSKRIRGWAYTVCPDCAKEIEETKIV